MFGSFLSSKKEDLSSYETPLLSAFSEVRIPELDKDVVSLNCIRNIRFEEDKAIIDLVLPTFALNSEKEVAIGVKQRAIEILPNSVKVELNVYADVQPAATQSLLKPGICDVRNIVLVASGKGGVGKSTVSSNLALALKNLGCRVGLLDADIYGPSIPTMFGVPSDQEIQGVKLENAVEPLMIPVERHGIKLMSVGFLVDTDSALVWRGPMIASMSMQMFFNVVWGDLDYLIVDLPPGTGDVQLTISQKVSVAGAIIVSTPQDVALADVIRAKAMFEKVNIPILGVVENMSYFICDGCSKKHDIFSHGGVRDAASKMKIDFLEEIPLVPSIRVACDTGEPIPLSGSVGQEFTSLAYKTASRLAKAALEPNLRPLPVAPTSSKPASMGAEKKKGLPVIN